MKPWWVSWYEPPHAGEGSWRDGRWSSAEDARGWETGWRPADGYVRCVAVVFAPDAAHAMARVQQLVGPWAVGIEWRGRPVEMDGPPSNQFRGAESWWNQMTQRRAA